MRRQRNKVCGPATQAVRRIVAAGLPLQSPDRHTDCTRPAMLTALYVRHFAVVEEAEIGFGAGLTVVSG